MAILKSTIIKLFNFLSLGDILENTFVKLSIIGHLFALSFLKIYLLLHRNV